MASPDCARSYASQLFARLAVKSRRALLHPRVARSHGSTPYIDKHDHVYRVREIGFTVRNDAFGSIARPMGALKRCMLTTPQTLYTSIEQLDRWRSSDIRVCFQ